MSSSVSTPPTFVSCLTPPGAAAIASLALRGPEAWDLVRRLFQPISSAGRPLPERPEPGRFWVGRMGTELADEVVLAVRSAHPVPWVELHCHGGREVLRLLLETLQAQGAQVCPWPVLEEQPLRATAAEALTQAQTVRTAAILLDQYQGAFARAAAAVRLAVERREEAETVRLLEELGRYAPLGRRLVSGWRVVVAGAPNVGKSSLVNALAGFQRSVVSAIPGTTRDLVTTQIAVDGWPVELTDTAGLRAGAATLEEQGIQRARSAVAAADLCLWILDGADVPVWPGEEPLSAPSPEVQPIINKVDLPAAWDWSQAANALRVSAQTSEGLAELCEALASWLVPYPPPPGAAVPFTGALCDAVAEAYRQARAGRFEEVQRIVSQASGAC